MKSMLAPAAMVTYTYAYQALPLSGWKLAILMVAAGAVLCGTIIAIVWARRR